MKDEDGKFNEDEFCRIRYDFGVPSKLTAGVERVMGICASSGSTVDFFGAGAATAPAIRPSSPSSSSSSFAFGLGVGVDEASLGDDAGDALGDDPGDDPGLGVGLGVGEGLVGDGSGVGAGVGDGDGVVVELGDDGEELGELLVSGVGAGVGAVLLAGPAGPLSGDGVGELVGEEVDPGLGEDVDPEELGEDELGEDVLASSSGAETAPALFVFFTIFSLDCVEMITPHSGSTPASAEASSAAAVESSRRCTLLVSR